MNIKELIPELQIRKWVGPFDDKEWYFNLGEEQAKKIIQWLSIKPEHNIVDIGCGCGRIAIHFLNYLSEQGKYIGIDNNRVLINYCKDNISVLKDNFQFKHINVFNGVYNKEGKLKAQEVTLPLADGSVDIVIMWSVFTHMYLNDIEAYLKEAFRVLNNGGRFLTTLNLYNEFTHNQINMDRSYLDIKYSIDENSYSLNSEVPEEGFAHKEDRIKEIFWRNGFRINEIKYGIWSCKEMKGEFHDCIIAEKIVRRT